LHRGRNLENQPAARVGDLTLSFQRLYQLHHRASEPPGPPRIRQRNPDFEAIRRIPNGNSRERSFKSSGCYWRGVTTDIRDRHHDAGIIARYSTLPDIT
jgi:hypothetical protein